MHALLTAHEHAARGAAGAALASVESQIAGPGALSRRHLLLRDGAGVVRGWASVHDRAGGRSLVAVVARGRGVATSLLHAVFADAAQRGHASIGIEVDETSATGAGALYLALGFRTTYVTQSWHRELPAA